MNTMGEVIRDIDRIKTDNEFAKRVYASLCNTQWKHDTEGDDQWEYACTWRAAGGLVDAIRTGERNEWGYMQFYCSGNEGHIDPEFAEIMAEHGWRGRETREDE